MKICFSCGKWLAMYVTSVSILLSGAVSIAEQSSIEVQIKEVRAAIRSADYRNVTFFFFLSTIIVPPIFKIKSSSSFFCSSFFNFLIN